LPVVITGFRLPTRRERAGHAFMHSSSKLGALIATLALLLCGCANLPGTGPRSRDVEALRQQPDARGIQIVDVDDQVARRLAALRETVLFSDEMSGRREIERTVGPGDSLEISIWEVPPATLFGAGVADPLGAPTTVRPMIMPEQVVDRDGFVFVPFAGRVRAAGQTLVAIAEDVAQRLKRKANQPEVLVRQLRSASTAVTVVGEVGTSVRMPLTPAGERLLDALAAAGGVRQPVNKTTIQVTRGSRYQALPLEAVIRDPRQNILLQPGDVVTAITQPLSVTVLGATGRNDELSFEVQGITLAQALARVGGLLDNRANPEGLFVFRFEQAGALDWPSKPVATTPEGLVPVIYRVNLRDPRSFFALQNFGVNNKDVIYVSNAPSAELQKFLNLVFSVTYPVLNLVNATN
jgi:polysaccharide biosynthesis/export protein